MSLSRNQRDLLIVAVILFGSILVCAVAYAVLPGFRVYVHRMFHEAFNWLEKHVLEFHL